jgi:DNA repair exonuclease SbcCD ATPase subunit
MITQIFHLADTHIRKGNVVDSRYDEYDNVFSNFVTDVKLLYKKDQCICVLCGDVFHHKLQISSHGIYLFYKLIHSIADMMPLIIIQGNHDLIQENDDENNDLIKALLDNHEHPNIHYKDMTGSFDIDNIHFGIVSIRDMLTDMAGSGLVDDLPSFPKPSLDKLNIALSHTTVKNCLLHNYTKSTGGVPIEWFRGYDAVLLGDIHLQSVKHNKKNNILYGYPGSLIQQDFGESLFKHGFLVWNIDENNQLTNVDKYHVFNPIGRANSKLMNNEVYINAENYIPLSDFLKCTKKPSDLHIRLYCKDNSSAIRQQIKNLLGEHDIRTHIDITTSNITSQNSESLSCSNITSINSSNTIIEFFKTHGNKDILNKNTHWEKYFDSKDNVLFKSFDNIPDTIKLKIQDKNAKLSKCIDNFQTSFTTKQNSFKIKTLIFNWLLSYGQDNVFHFADDRICLINAPNGFGKSAFFECIVLGLFGEPVPSRFNKATSSSIINKQKSDYIDCNVKIQFTVNDNDFTIVRHYHAINNKKYKNVVVELYEGDSLIKTTSKLVNNWVNQNICTLQDFLLSTMITQNFDNDFFKLKVADQIELLDNVLHMDNVNNIIALMKESKKEYKDLKNHMDTYINALKPNDSFDACMFNDLETSLQQVQQKLDTLKQRYNDIPLIHTKSIAIDDTLKNPEESLECIMKEESMLNKKLNILNIDEHEQFDTFDLSVDQFIDEEFDNGNNPSKHLHFDKRTCVKDVIATLRDLNDKYKFYNHNCHNILSNKPEVVITQTLHEYNEFQTKLIKFRKKCKNFNKEIPQEPDFDLNDMKDKLNEKIIKLSNHALTQIIKHSNKKENIGSHRFNPDCWACNENFCSNEAIEAIAVLEYRNKESIDNEWNTYLKNKKSIDTLNELETAVSYWESLLPQIEAFESWSVDYANVKNKINEWFQKIVDQQYILKETFDYQNRCNQAFSIFNELDKCKLKKQYFVNEKLKIKYQIEIFENQEKILLIKLAKASLLKDQEMEYIKNVVLMEDFTVLLTDKVELFGHFVDTFKKYKSWIYNDKLLPAIVNQTNHILHNIFQNRVLKLNFEFVDNNVLFTVLDELNEINMEKLSGAQSFAVSLSFRLALSSIGINKFRCNQLFIDEGFCSFDQKNLLNVPTLIKNLKNLFQEIILVTHLEDIKSCADCVVNITRKHGISQIRH